MDDGAEKARVGKWGWQVDMRKRRSAFFMVVSCMTSVLYVRRSRIKDIVLLWAETLLRRYADDGAVAFQCKN